LAIVSPIALCSLRRAVERWRRPHANPPSVEPRAAAPRRDEQFTLERVERHRKHEPYAMLVGDRNAELRKTMREIGGTVERINNTSMRAPPRDRTALLREDRVVRKGAVEPPDNRLFGFPVGLGNDIDRVGLGVTLIGVKRRKRIRSCRVRGVQRGCVEVWQASERASYASRMTLLDERYDIQRAATGRESESATRCQQ
jgi:hypothetical protein